ncbi:MAG: histidinol-phosphate transaminase [Bacteroidota bacterium]
MKNKVNIESLIRENVKYLEPYSSARDEFKDTHRTDMVFLDANENPFESGVNRYPDPLQRNLKAKIAHRNQVSMNQILLGNGSDEVLDLLFRAFCEPKEDNIITLPPTYGMYKVLAGINAVENREVLLTDNFEPNVSQILKVQDAHSKLLFLCSPNNPTGNSFSEEDVLELLSKFNGLVVIDEAYIHFSEKDSWLQRLEEFPNLIIIQTLSKAYGMAGIRLGICFASSYLIAILNRIKPPYNVNELTQQRANERYSKLNNLNNEISLLLKEKDKLSKLLLQVNFVKRIYPSDTNFLLIQVDNATLRYDQLIQKGIVVRNRSNQPLCTNTLRITIGTPWENEKLINTLKTIE